jgi:hypothetical protein
MRPGAHRESAAQYERALRFASDLDPARAQRCFTDGIAFCDQRELGVYSLCLMGWRTLRRQSGESDLALQEARAGYRSGLGRTDSWTLGSAATWLTRLERAAGVRRACLRLMRSRLPAPRRAT